MNEEFEIKDTFGLQVRSLEAFALMLGYTLTELAFENDFFYSDHKRNKHRASVSVRSMIALHNGAFTDWNGATFREPFIFSREQTKAAWEAKLVAKVKLQYSKKKKKFVMQSKQSNIVEFTKEIYEEIFLG